MKANIASNKVGDESTCQFSREFKRYFGKSPTDAFYSYTKGTWEPSMETKNANWQSSKKI